MSEEEKEAIKNLKHIKQHWKPPKSDELATIEYESICICLNLIEKQQKEIDKLKSENQIFQRIKNGTTIIFKAKKKYIIEDKINKYYISKNKIRAKIEELEKQQEENRNKFSKGIDCLDLKLIDDSSNKICINYSVRSILEELLEENNNE